MPLLLRLPLPVARLPSSVLRLFFFLLAASAAHAQGGVLYVWSGAVTPSGVRVNARPADAEAPLRLVVSERADLSDPAHVSPVVRAEAESRIAAFEVEGLEPATRYHYAVEVGGTLDTLHAGTFRTFPKVAFSFRVATGSCSRTASGHRVFERIAAFEPYLFLHLGDFHYENLGRNDPEVFRRAYAEVLASPTQGLLFRTTPVAYTWDDHDYGPNNSDRRSPSRTAARKAYRQVVPHYDLAAGDGPRGDGDAPIYQTFSMGRVRFILLDTRSERDPASARDDSTKSMLGEEQKAWLKAELLAARDEAALILLVSAVPWISDDGGDRWSNYTTERRELARFIASNGIRNLLMVSGDGHMLAYDNGTNNRYAGGPGFPVLQAGALDRQGSVKGGPYTVGPWPNREGRGGATDGQFALIEIEDQGGDFLCATITGHRQPHDSDALQRLFRQRQCFAAPLGDKSADPEPPPTPGDDPLRSTLGDETR